MDAKAFMMVLNYHKNKIKKLEMTAPEAGPTHSQRLFLTVTPRFSCTPDLSVIWWWLSNYWYLINSQMKSSTSTDFLGKHFSILHQSVSRASFGVIAYAALKARSSGARFTPTVQDT